MANQAAKELKNMKTKILTTILSLLIFLPMLASAQANGSGVSISHVPLKAEQLPFPGAPLKISVALENSKNSQYTLKGFFTRDGKILEQSLEEFAMNDNGQITYSTTIHAPLAELNYQFVLLDRTTPLAHSKRYAMRRSCIPNIQSASGEISKNPVMKEKIKNLQMQATSIQDEVLNYESAIRMLEELKILTEK